MLMLDFAMKSPCEEYRDHIREAVRNSPKTQEQIALEAGLEPSNLSNLLAGRRKPLLNPAKNLALASACGQTPSFANDIQLVAEACHGINNQPQDFRRYMALAIRTLEALMQQMITEVQSLQDWYRHGDIPDALFTPESLLAAKTVVNSLRYWWPVEAHDRWDDYQVIADRFRERLSQLSPGRQLDTLVQWEMEEALEWVRDMGDLDPKIEKMELTRRLANALGIDPTAFRQVIGGLEAALGQNLSQVRRQPSPKKIFSISRDEDSTRDEGDVLPPNTSD